MEHAYKCRAPWPQCCHWPHWSHSNCPHGPPMAKVWPPPFLLSGSLVLLSRSGEPRCPDGDAQCFAAFCPTKLGTQYTNHYLVSTSASAVIYAKPLPVLLLPLQTTDAMFSQCHTIPNHLWIICNTYQNSNGILHRRRKKKILKFLSNCKSPQTAKVILRKKNKARVITIPHFKPNYKAIEI